MYLKPNVSVYTASNVRVTCKYWIISSEICKLIGLILTTIGANSGGTKEIM